MTIEPQVFAELLSELEVCYKYEFTPYTKRVWFKLLSDRLSTEEFIAAVEQVIFSNQFMPSAEQLVEAIKGNAQTLAVQEWNLCVQAAASNDRNVRARLSPQGQFALATVGGVFKLGKASEQDLHWIKKEFVSIWKTAPADIKSLPASRTSNTEYLDAVQSLAQKMSFKN